jgi:DNA-binding NarL/FixJ family response regulator
MLELSTNGVAPADEAGGALGTPRRGVPDPELVEQAKRRTFTAKYEARILAEADACTAPGAVGELLRREGLSTAEIAERLYVSRSTVKTHINQIFCKTGSRDRPQAIAYAHRHGITQSRQDPAGN